MIKYRYKIRTVYRPDASSEFTITVITLMPSEASFWDAHAEADRIKRGYGQPYSRRYHIQQIDVIEDFYREGDENGNSSD